MRILDRSGARKALGGTLSSVRDGSGGAVLVAGAAGMGKTTLIRDARARARESGFRVLTAVAAAAERDRRLGVIEQLTGVAGSSPERFHRFVHRLSGHAPLLISVDDVHETDAASLECLLYLLRRVETSRVLLVFGERTGWPETGAKLSTEFVRDPRCTLVRLAALSAEDTASFLGGEPDEAAVSRWRRMSGGSPLLLQALLADRTGDAGPEPGEAFALAVRCLIDGQDAEVSRIACGLALLGGSATPSALDRLLRLPGGTAAGALRALDAIGLTESGRYRTELARSAVLETMTAADRAEWEHRAARLLYEERGTSAAIARHLVACGPVTEAWAVPVLRSAADQALRENDAERAATCLRTAYDACGDDLERAAVRADLARAEWEADPAAVLVHLDGLLEEHRRGRLDERQSIRLIGYLMWHGRPEDADEILTRLDAADGRGTEEDRVRLEAMRLWFAYAYPLPGSRYRRRSVLDRMELRRRIAAVDPQSGGALVLHALISDGPTAGAMEAAERLLQGLVLHDPPVAPAMAALASFVRSARMDRASAWCDVLYEGAGPRTPAVRAILAAASATVESRRGAFDVARERADRALSLMSPAAWGVAVGIPLAAKALACTAQGDHETAAECFGVPVPEAMFQALPGLHYLHARGRHHLAARRYRAALGDLHACRELMTRWRMDVSPALSWRTPAAEALSALGDRDGASTLLEEEAWQSPALIGRLSKAEQRVVRMACQGLGNREIAERLFVTTSTVEQHLTRAYHKLGVRGRADLREVLGPETSGGGPPVSSVHAEKD